jgi:hypothetical protein
LSVLRTGNHYKINTKSSAWRRAVRHLKGGVDSVRALRVSQCHTVSHSVTQCPNEKDSDVEDKIFILHFFKRQES